MFLKRSLRSQHLESMFVVETINTIENETLLDDRFAFDRLKIDFRSVNRRGIWNIMSTTKEEAISETIKDVNAMLPQGVLKQDTLNRCED